MTSLQIADIRPDVLSENTANHFIDRAAVRSHDREDISLSDFERFMLVKFGAYITYLAVDNQRTPTSKTTSSLSKVIYFVDMLPQDIKVGFGEISCAADSQDPYYRQKPVVLLTETIGGDDAPRNYRQKGFGRQRYLTMNQASLLIFGFPLHSREQGIFRSSDATRRWEKFVAEGLAESYIEHELDGRPIQRYRFKAPLLSNAQ